MVRNIVIGKPLVEPKDLLALNDNDWENAEKEITTFTNERWLPAIMVQSGVVSSISEVKRNKPQLVKMLDALDFLEIKWGKSRLYIIVGE